MTSNLIKEAEFEAVGQRGKTYTITQVLEDKNLYESKSRTYKRVNELTSYWVKGGGAAKIIDANRFFYCVARRNRIPHKLVQISYRGKCHAGVLVVLFIFEIQLHYSRSTPNR